MKKSLENLNHFKMKELFKKVKLIDILYILAVILLLLQAFYSYKVYKDPCSYCQITIREGEKYTCKEYFDIFIKSKININEEIWQNTTLKK